MGKDHLLVFPLFYILMHDPGMSEWTTFCPLYFLFRFYSFLTA